MSAPAASPVVFTRFDFLFAGDRLDQMMVETCEAVVRDCPEAWDLADPEDHPMAEERVVYSRVYRIASELVADLKQGRAPRVVQDGGPAWKVRVAILSRHLTPSTPALREEKARMDEAAPF